MSFTEQDVDAWLDQVDDQPEMLHAAIARAIARGMTTKAQVVQATGAVVKTSRQQDMDRAAGIVSWLRENVTEPTPSKHLQEKVEAEFGAVGNSFTILKKRAGLSHYRDAGVHYDAPEGVTTPAPKDLPATSSGISDDDKERSAYDPIAEAKARVERLPEAQPPTMQEVIETARVAWAVIEDPEPAQTETERRDAIKALSDLNHAVTSTLNKLYDQNIERR